MRYKLRLLYATLGLWIGAPVVIFHAPNWPLIGVGLVVGAILSIYGYNVGAHYAFCHRAMRFSRPVQLALIYLTTLATGSSPVAWAASHAMHHRYADREGDPNSPTRLGWKAPFLVFHGAPTQTAPVRHLIADPVHRWADSNVGYWLMTLSWPLLASLAGVDGLVYLWLLPLVYVQGVAVAFVYAHAGGKPRKSWLLDVLSFGDGDHIGHHERHEMGKGPRLFATLIGGRS